MSDPNDSSTYIDKRHEYLERRALNPDNEWTRCYCGGHVDEKAELLAYRRQVRRMELDTMTPLERLKAQFEGMTPEQKELHLLELTTGG